MKTGGFKRTVVLGTAAAALFLVGGCRQQHAQEVPQDIQRQQEAQDTQQAPATGGAGQAGSDEQPVDINKLPDQEGFQSVPEQQEAPHGIGEEDEEGAGGSQVNPHQQRDPK